MTIAVPGAVVIAHPARLFCETLAATLGDAGVPGVRHYQDLGTAVCALTTGPATLTLAASELAPDGVVDLVSRLLDAGSSSVVVLAREVHEPDLLAALEAGALGYVSRDEPLDRLVFDIQGALNGQACLPRDKLAPILRLLIERRREEDGRAERLRRLSRREREVLDKLADGSNNDEVAAALFLSRATVRTHIQNILGKLEVHSRLEAISLVRDEL